MSASVPDGSAQVSVQPGPPVVGTIRPPGSKSLTNRAVLCAAAGRGACQLTGALVSEDTDVMLAALRSVGVQVSSSRGGTTVTLDADGRKQHTAPGPLPIFVANSGTTIRFLTAMLSAWGGHYRLAGVPRMHQRPLAPLVDALSDVVDGRVVTESPQGCPPVVIQTEGWKGTKLSVGGDISSQYLSGLLMAAPVVGRPVVIQVEGALVSKPYVEMTCRVMETFGAEVSRTGEGTSFEVQPTGYAAESWDIEPDASAASYFWAAAAITGGEVRVEGLTADALQGDVAFCDVLEQMGCHVQRDSGALTVSGRAEHGIDIDMNAISDTVQTLAVVALFASSPTRVRGVAHNRFKETDRIADLARELRKLGANVQEFDDGLAIEPLPPASAGASVLETYEDHRMAMSLALAGLKIPNVWIDNPSCTAKTYPNYFADLERLLGHSHRWRSAPSSSWRKPFS